VQYLLLFNTQAEQANRLVVPEGTGSAGANRPRAASAADEANGAAAAPPSPRMADPDVIRSFDPLHQPPPPRPPPPHHAQQGQSQSGGPLQARGINLYIVQVQLVGFFCAYLREVRKTAVYVKLIKVNPA
jgi:hypothetical protein